ncbi:hypothetical protein [Kribbella sp. NPDC004536]|uniref:hypothetical protein n=1 Tax=Kribbella sp. NPDC004536 TaxID=3364106 RepID=UPI0036C32B4B
MALSIFVRTYSGDVVERSSHPNLGELFSAASTGRQPLLASVDHYDDTVFNSRQAQIIVQELRDLQSAILEPDTLAAADELNRLAGKVAGRAHHYLVVDGD